MALEVSGGIRSPSLADNADDYVSGVNCQFSVAMIEDMAKQADVSLKMGNGDELGHLAPICHVVPNYAFPSPVLIRYKPFLASQVHQPPKKPRPVLQLRKSSQIANPNAVSSVDAVVVPKVLEKSVVVKNPKKRARAGKGRDMDEEMEHRATVRRQQRVKAVVPPLLPTHHFRTRANSMRPVYIERVLFLKPEPNINPVDPVNVRIVTDNPKLASVKHMVKGFRAMGVKCKVQGPGTATKPQAVRPKGPITHVIIPRLNTKSLFVTSAIASGAWRVPYEWAEESIEKGTLLDEHLFPASYRSNHNLFRNRTFLNLLSDPQESLRISVVLDFCGAISAADTPDEPRITIVDDINLPAGSDPQYWTPDDFYILFSQVVRNYALQINPPAT